MKKVVLVLFMLGICLSAFAEGNTDALTLKDCYALALKKSETVAIQKELINETKGLVLQAMSLALPKVSFAYTEKWQDVSPNDRFDGSQPEGKFTFSQPLFTGFKEFAAIGANKHIGLQRDAELKRARQLLLIDVSDAFYLYLSYQEDLEQLKDIEKALLERMTELKKRQSIGRSRLSEVSSADARLRKVQADIEGVHVQKDVAGELMNYLTGVVPSRLIDDVLPEEEITIDVLAQQVVHRADVEAVREAVRSYENNIIAARSSFFPTVTLGGNSYTKRVGTNEGNDWDVSLVVSVPLFNGLSDVGQLRQARSQKDQMELRLSKVIRQATLEVKSAHLRWRGYSRRLTALDLAVTSAQENYRLQQEDFQKSLVNNLDVLQALEDLSNIRRGYISAKADARRAFWSLKVATGGDLQ
jgi:outer membrane protein